MSLSKNINPSLVLVQPRKTSPYITERLLMGRKEANQRNKASCNKDELNPVRIHQLFFLYISGVLNHSIKKTGRYMYQRKETFKATDLRSDDCAMKSWR